MSIDVVFDKQRIGRTKSTSDIIRFDVWGDKADICRILNAYPAVCNNFTIKPVQTWHEVTIPLVYADYAGFASMLRRLDALGG